MGNVVSIFQKKKKVEEPSSYVEHYLKESLENARFQLVTDFEKRWDPDANLWRIEVQVQQPDKAPQQMAFWYDGDEPQFATEISIGQKFDYRKADRVVRIHENG